MARMATRRERWRPAVRAEQADGVTVLCVSGRIGEAGAADEALRAALDEGLASDGALVVDLSEVDYVSSPGLRLLEDCATRAADSGRPLVFCGLTDAVRMAVDLAGLAPRLTCADNVEAARALR